jgi:acetyltransferase-like isoleucine patch superfamily enzyme
MILSGIVPKRIRIKLLQYLNSKNYDVKFGKGASASKTFFEGKNFVNSDSHIINSYIGLATYISGDCKLSKIKIGRFCSIGQNLKNHFSLHPGSDFISTHPAFFSTKKQAGFTFVEDNSFEESKYVDEDKKYYSIIGNDVWIGNDVKIMEGIEIGDGAIIATGAIVTKDVAPYSIVGGVPAKLIRFRFTKEEIDLLIETKWWEKDISWITVNANNFSSFGEFNKCINK